MYTMSTDMADGTGTTSTVFHLLDVDRVIVSVEDSGAWTTGTVQVQYSPDNGTTWYDLDTTNLAFTAAGQKAFIWEDSWVRLSSSSMTDANTLPAFISGDNVNLLTT